MDGRILFRHVFCFCRWLNNLQSLSQLSFYHSVTGVHIISGDIMHSLPLCFLHFWLTIIINPKQTVYPFPAKNCVITFGNASSQVSCRLQSSQLEFSADQINKLNHPQIFQLGLQLFINLLL